MMTDHSYQPIILIGAGRSGTNMLRDILIQMSTFGSWPCDELPYVWRHGNIHYPNDELMPQHASHKTKAYIRNCFSSLAKTKKFSSIVEKTCANSLRVNFVDATFPNAKYLFLIRDGRDVVASSLKRWTAPLDFPYLLKKGRYIPIVDMPYYGKHFIWNRIHQKFSRKKRLAFWGPRFKNIDEMLRTHSLPEVCAMQWRCCVEKSDKDFHNISNSRVHRLYYENFVQSPTLEMKKICNFLDIHISTSQIHRMVEKVTSSSVGKWQYELSDEILELIYPIIQPVLKNHSYLV